MFYHILINSKYGWNSWGVGVSSMSAIRSRIHRALSQGVLEKDILVFGEGPFGYCLKCVKDGRLFSTRSIEYGDEKMDPMFYEYTKNHFHEYTGFLLRALQADQDDYYSPVQYAQHGPNFRDSVIWGYENGFLSIKPNKEVHP